MSWYYWTLFIISAFVPPMAFICEWFWCGVFVFPIIFFWVAIHSRLTFMQGLLWGLIIWSMHLGAPLYGLALKAQGPLGYRLLPLFAVIFYGALCTGAWFWLINRFLYASYVVQFVVRDNAREAPFRLGTWTVGFWCYFYFVSYVALAWGNRIEGFCLMNPLIPLAACPPLLFLLPKIGAPCLLFLLLVSCACVTWFLKSRTWCANVFVFVAVCPWIFSVVAYTQLLQAVGVTRGIQGGRNTWLSGEVNYIYGEYSEWVPAWVTHVAYAPVMYCSDGDTAVRAHQMGRAVMRMRQNNPDAELIIFPESCLYGLCDAHELCALVYDYYVKKPLHIICGGFELHGCKWHNVLYWFFAGKIQAAFCKRHAVVLAEALPAWFQIAPVMRCYFHDMPEIVPGDNVRPQFELCFTQETVHVVPYICSELFFYQYPDDEFEGGEGSGESAYGSLARGNDIGGYADMCRPGNCIIEIANDSWAVWESSRRLMVYGAIFKAIAWQRDILYVSYYYGVYINKFGQVVHLA